MVFKWIKGNKKSPNSSEISSTGGAVSSGAGDLRGGMVENAVALASGLEMTDAYYPGHDPIDYYGDGGFKFGSMSHQGALMFLPSVICRWDAPSIENLSEESFGKLFQEKDDIEILLVGTGHSLVQLAPTVTDSIRDAGIKLEIMDTGAAVRTLNILLSEDRAVAAALLPVD